MYHCNVLPEEISPSTSWPCLSPRESAVFDSLCREFPPITPEAIKKKEFQMLSQDVLTPQMHLSCCYPKGSLCTRIHSQEAVAHSLRENCAKHNHWPMLIFPSLLKFPTSDILQQRSLEEKSGWRVRASVFKVTAEADCGRSHTRIMREKDYREQGKLRALPGVEDFLHIAIDSSKPFALVSCWTVSHSRHLCWNSFFCGFYAN